MASITNDPNGRRRLQFTGADKKRRAIRLGKLSRRDAETIKNYVERLVSAQVAAKPIDRETQLWLGSIGDKLTDKLAKAGLIPERKSEFLGAFIESYVDARGSAVAAGTLLVWQQAIRNLLDYFGIDKPLRDVTAGDAEDFKVSIKKEGLAESTARKRCAFASQLFGHAVKHRLIDSNPFDGVKKANQSTPKSVIISEADSRAVLQQLPDTQWRLLFGLARWGALRVGSEVRLLRWSDIDWAGRRFFVRSVKTRRYQGKESRMVPIFPELSPLFDDRYDEAADGEELVLPMLCGRTDASFRDPLLRAIGWAGVAVWPRLWHTLRVTRQTELEDQFPSHVVCAWCGNSEEVAKKHYLKLTEEHFAKASHLPDEKQQKRLTKRLGQCRTDLPLRVVSFERSVEATPEIQGFGDGMTPNETKRHLGEKPADSSKVVREGFAEIAISAEGVRYSAEATQKPSHTSLNELAEILGNLSRDQQKSLSEALQRR